MFLQPDFLKANDTIAIVAPARKVEPETIFFAVSIFESWGLRVVLGKNLFEEDYQFSGTDKQRLDDFQEMLDNPDVKAVVCARGGYGSSRIIDALQFDAFCKNPKWIVGYSDISVLHAHIQTNFKIQTLHAAMPAEFCHFPSNCAALLSLKNSLFNYPFPYPAAEHLLNKPGTAEGFLVGGNLSILYSLQGTSSEIDTEGKILFIEDLDEYLYHIDRMMETLKRSNKLKHLKGLIVGSMSDMHDNTISFGKTAEEIILDKVKEYEYPVVFNFPAGHCKENNYALILGRKISLSVTLQKAEIRYV